MFVCKDCGGKVFTAKEFSDHVRVCPTRPVVWTNEPEVKEQVEA